MNLPSHRQQPHAPAPVRRATATATVQAFPERPQALMHRGVYKIALLCWAGFLSVFWITFWVSTGARFMVTVGTFYALMYLGVPVVMSRMAPTRPRQGSLAAFLRGRFSTFNRPDQRPGRAVAGCSGAGLPGPGRDRHRHHHPAVARMKKRRPHRERLSHF